MMKTESKATFQLCFERKYSVA